jgi:hypothetical protein
LFNRGETFFYFTGAVIAPGHTPYRPEANWSEFHNYIYAQNIIFKVKKKLIFFNVPVIFIFLKKNIHHDGGYQSLPKTLKLFYGKAVSAIQARKREKEYTESLS